LAPPNNYQNNYQNSNQLTRYPLMVSALPQWPQKTIHPLLDPLQILIRVFLVLGRGNGVSKWLTPAEWAQ